MRVSELVIYPIKGMAGIRVKSLMIEDIGPALDRQFMIIDRDNRFVSQRTMSKLALCTVEVSEKTINISYDNSSIAFSIDDRIGEAFVAKVWDDDALVYDVSSSVNKWLDRQIGVGFRLVALKDNTARSHQISGTTMSTFVSLADGYPVLIVGSASLDLLNSKLDDPIGMDRFRPNIVVDTEIPHVEDTWQVMRIGDAVLRHVKPCVRCQVITIDQQTAQSSKEPLRTLATYRRVENGVIFGSNLILEEPGVVSVGDRVEVLE